MRRTILIPIYLVITSDLWNRFWLVVSSLFPRFKTTLNNRLNVAFSIRCSRETKRQSRRRNIQQTKVLPIVEFVDELTPSTDYYHSLLHTNYSSSPRVIFKIVKIVKIVKSGKRGKEEGGRSRFTHSFTQVREMSLEFILFSIKLVIRFNLYLIYRSTSYRLWEDFLLFFKFPIYPRQAPEFSRSSS